MTAIGGVSGSSGFEPSSFWAFLQDAASRLGKGLLEKALIAYYVAVDIETPPWARAELAGALVYLGLPIDAVPDYLPVVGFSDDVAVLGLALAAVAANVRLRHVRRARGVLRTWGITVDEADSGSDEGTSY